MSQLKVSSENVATLDCSNALQTSIECLHVIENDSGTCVDDLLDHINLLTVLCSRKVVFQEDGNAFKEKVLFDFCLECFNAKISKHLFGKLFNLFDTCCNNDNIKNKCLEQFLKPLLAYIQLALKHEELDLDSFGINLKLIFHTIKNVSDISCFDSEITNKIFQYCCQLLHLEFVNDDHLQIVIAIIRLLMNGQNDNDHQIEAVWSCLSKLMINKEEIKLYTILSALVPSFVTSVIIERDDFWFMVQEGLISSDGLTRKRSLYTLKLLLDVVSKRDSFQTIGHSPPVISWETKHSDNFWNVWKTIILILECLDEKQLHVVQPCLSSFQDVVNTIADTDHSLHITWLFVIIRRTMAHEAKPLQKWAVLFVLDLPIDKMPMIHSSVGHTFIFKHLMVSLKSMVVYTLEENSEQGSPPAVLELLKTFLQNCLDSLSGQDQIDFSQKMLEAVVEFGFNDLAMTYVTKAISQLKMTTKLTSKHVDLLKTLLNSKLSFLRIEFQQMIFYHLILFFTENTEMSDAVFSSFINLLVPALPMRLVPIDGQSWSTIITFMHKIDYDTHFNSAKSLIFTMLGAAESLEINKTAVSTLCLAFRIKGFEDLTNLLLPITDIVHKLPTSPYLDEKKIRNVLHLLEVILINIVHSISFEPLQNLSTYLSSLYPYISQYLTNLHNSLLTENVNEDILEKCVKIVELYSRYFATNHQSTSSPQDASIQQRMYKSVISNLSYDNKVDTINYKELLHHSVTVKLYNTLVDDQITDNDTQMMVKHVIKFLTTTDRMHITKLTKSFLKTNCFSTGVIVTDSWNTLRKLLSSSDVLTAHNNADSLFEVLLNDLDILSHLNLSNAISVLQYFVISINEDDHLITIIDVLWRIVVERLGTDNSFWQLCSQCFAIIFHPKFLLSKSDSLITSKLLDLSQQILQIGEKKAGVVNIMLDQCIKVWNNCDDIELLENSLMTYISFLTHITMFGPLRNKNERQRAELIQYFSKLKHYTYIKTLQSSDTQNQNVRISFINFILALPGSPILQQFIQELFVRLIDLDKTFVKQKQSYYSDSEIHRKKIRLWQTVLVLMSLHRSSTVENDQFILSKVCDTFSFNNQPSVRHLIEWVIILLLYKHEYLIESLWSNLDAAAENKIISVTSIFSIFVQLIKIQDSNQFKGFISTAVFRILPWAQAQHLASRVHAQVTLEAMWEAMKSRNCVELQTKFDFLHHCFTLSEKNTTAVKQRKTLLNHPIYSKFHPLRHYTLQSIFHGILTLTDYAAEEYINADVFVLPECEEKHSLVSLKQYDDELGVLCRLRNIPSTVPDSTLHGKELIDMQKKIMPWRVAPPTEDVLLQSELENKRQSKVSDLVLCAVLVEKIPNLGGLCRTAEIFGAKSLVIGSQRYLQDPNFKSLSVTAEQWIDIEQVVPVKLSKWLEEMKESGYSIVGVEQTANSQMIGDYQFPKKCVLVLGNEKTGIPVEIIQHVDTCVEIPQYGIIRSLNVHISGAIMVWEYSKQHMSK